MNRARATTANHNRLHGGPALLYGRRIWSHYGPSIDYMNRLLRSYFPGAHLMVSSKGSHVGAARERPGLHTSAFSTLCENISRTASVLYVEVVCLSYAAHVARWMRRGLAMAFSGDERRHRSDLLGLEPRRLVNLHDSGSMLEGTHCLSNSLAPSRAEGVFFFCSPSPTLLGGPLARPQNHYRGAP